MSSLLKNNNSYDIAILFGLSIIGFIVKIIFQKSNQNENEGPATASIWGYGIILISLICLLFIKISLAIKNKINITTFESFKIILTSSTPILFIILLVLWNIFLNITYKKQINTGKVSKEYNTFGNISSVLFILQLMIIFKYLKNTLNNNFENNTNKGIFSSSLIALNYLIGIINLIIISFMQAILDYFSTDG